MSSRLLVCCLLTIHLVDFILGQELRICSRRRAYDEINRFLEKIHENNIETRLNEAIDWLQTNKKLTNNVCIEGDALEMASNQLKGLRQLIQGDEKLCGANGYQILSANAVDSGLGSSSGITIQDSSKLRSIDEIVFNITLKHAKKCQPIYQAAFEDKYKQLNAKIIGQVETFVYGYLCARLEYILMKTNGRQWTACSAEKLENYLNELHQDQIEHLMQLDNWFQDEKIEILYDGFSYLASESEEDDMDVIYVYDTDEIEQLFKSRLIEPCKYYIRELGIDILGPALYEASFLKLDSSPNIVGGRKNRTKCTENIGLVLAEANFQVCSSLVLRQNSLMFELSDYLELVNSDDYIEA